MNEAWPDFEISGSHFGRESFEGPESFYFHERKLSYFSPKAFSAWGEIMRHVAVTDPLKDAVEACLRVVELSDGKVEPQGLRIIGGVGTGKSLCIRLLRSKLKGQRLLGFNDRTTLLSTILPYRATRLTLIREVLGIFNHPLHTGNTRGATADVKLKIMCQSMRAAGTKALVIDEAQNIFTQIRTRGVNKESESDVADALRQVMESVKIPIILIGTNSLSRLEHLDEGLASRIRKTVYMRDLQGDLWGLVLKSFYECMRNYCQPDLLKEKKAQAEIQSFCQGQLRQFKRLMAELVLLAVHHEKPVLTYDSLENALRNLRQEMVT